MSEPTLLRDLLRVFAASAAGKPAEGVREALGTASPAAWERALVELDGHRVSGLIGAALLAEGLLESLPGEVARSLQEASVASRARNLRRLERFFQALHALRDADAEPTLLKSAGMACRFPALLVHNQMSDVDLYIAADRLPTLEAVLEQDGFVKGDSTRDAVYFRDESGELVLDIHHRFRLFEHLDFSSVTRCAEMALLPGETATVLTPEAELVHLVYHENGHRAPHGYSLRWLIDQLVLVIEEGPVMETGKLVNAAPDVSWSFWTARLLGFFEQELGVQLGRLPGLPAPIEGFSIDEVLVSRRHASFPLDQLRGWKSLIACKLGLREMDQKIYPRPLDAVRQHRFLRAEERLKQGWQPGGQSKKSGRAVPVES